MKPLGLNDNRITYTRCDLDGYYYILHNNFEGLNDNRITNTRCDHDGYYYFWHNNFDLFTSADQRPKINNTRFRVRGFDFSSIDSIV